MAGGDKPLPAPKNTPLEILNIVLDVLLKGLGADAAIVAAQTAFPVLGLPVVGWLFSAFVRRLAASLDLTLQKQLDVVLIRYQGGAKKAAYDKVLSNFKTQMSGQPTPQEKSDAIKSAIKAADNLIHMGG